MKKIKKSFKFGIFFFFDYHNFSEKLFSLFNKYIQKKKFKFSLKKKNK